MTATRSATPSRAVLHERSRTTVYVDHDGDRPIVIRVLNDPQPTLDELARFQRDLSITRHLDIPGGYVEVGGLCVRHAGGDSRRQPWRGILAVRSAWEPE